MFQEILEECKFQLERLGRGDMGLARGQERAILPAEQGVDGHEVIECLPVFRRVLHTPGNQDGPRRHQRVQIDEVLAGIDQFLVEPGARVR